MQRSLCGRLPFKLVSHYECPPGILLTLGPPGSPFDIQIIFYITLSCLLRETPGLALAVPVSSRPGDSVFFNFYSIESAPILNQLFEILKNTKWNDVPGLALRECPCGYLPFKPAPRYECPPGIRLTLGPPGSPFDIQIIFHITLSSLLRETPGLALAVPVSSRPGGAERKKMSGGHF